MSTNDTDDVYTAPPLSGQYRPRLNATASLSHTPSRHDLAMGEYMDSENPTIWNAVGYPSDDALDSFETHWLRYERQGIARGIIDKPANDTWQELPTITDAVEADEEDTAFEQAAQRLLQGETLRRSPLHRFNVADRLAMLGEFSVMVLGFSDGRDLETPVQGVDADPTDEEPWGQEDGEFDGLEDLHYVATFGQDRVSGIERVTDMTDPRFRLPESYEIVTEAGREDDDPETQTVHWTRVIHVTEGTLEDDLRGTPYLKPIFHNLVNLDKILAGSAEGYWRGGYQGLVVRPPTGPDGSLLHFSEGTDTGAAEELEGSSDALQDQIREYQENLKRVIATTGEVESLGTQVANPAQHVEQQFKEIAAAKDIPQSVLMGNETGERATTEDSQMWKEHIAGRRANYAEPVILNAFIDRLIAVGVLPFPSGDGYTAEWPPLDELSEQEEADIALTLAQAASELTAGAPDRIASRAELRHVLGWGPTLGSEVDGATIQPEDGDVDDPEADDIRVDESDEEVQDAFADQQGDDGTPPGAGGNEDADSQDGQTDASGDDDEAE